MNNLRKLLNEIIITTVSIIAVIAIIVAISKSKSMKKLKVETERKLYSTEQLHAIQLDSLKLKILQDSLYIVDLQRVKQINNLNTQDKYDKAKHDLTIAIIPTADDMQRNRLWSIYSPKD